MGCDMPVIVTVVPAVVVGTDILLCKNKLVVQSRTTFYGIGKASTIGATQTEILKPRVDMYHPGT